MLHLHSLNLQIVQKEFVKILMLLFSIPKKSQQYIASI